MEKNFIIQYKELKHISNKKTMTTKSKDPKMNKVETLNINKKMSTKISNYQYTFCALMMPNMVNKP